LHHNSLSAMATDKRDYCYERIVADRLVTVLDSGKPAGWLRRKAMGRSQEEAVVPPKG
jgi:uncharacterized Ntn-hydrolase superfamily protein